MDCTICGKSTLPGMMLCAPCKAALKRARYVTVQEDMRRPSIIDVRRQPRRAHASPAVATPEPEPARTSRLRLFSSLNSNSGRPVVIGILALAALGAVAYVGQQETGAHARDDASAALVLVPEVRQVIAAKVATTQPAATEIVPPPVEAKSIEPTGTDVSPHAQSATRPAVTAAVKRTILADRASFATANGDPPDAVNPPPEPEKLVAMPAPPPPPVPDRWQNMRDGLARCDSEGVFNGIICGQRVRIQYCEGYWGKVAQCPGAAANYER